MIAIAKKTKLQVFEHYYDVASRKEDEVRQYGHLDWNPNYREECDEELEAAYRNIEPYLRTISKLRMFRVPANVPGLRPFSAVNCHEARMYFLNPPKALRGSIGALTSPEYIAIKDGEEKELAALFGLDEKIKTGKRRRRSNLVQIELISTALQDYVNQGCPDGKPTQEKIGHLIEISQGEVSKTFRDVGPDVCPGGFDGLVARMMGVKDSGVANLGNVMTFSESQEMTIKRTRRGNTREE